MSWEPGSSVQLCRVNWDANYQNVVNWEHGQVQRDTYFEALEKASFVLSESTYMPFNASIVIDCPWEKARKYNYVIVKNPAQPVDGDTDSTLYYFIDKSDYVNPSSTRLNLSLDVWTTRYPSFRLKTGYLERGSLGLANIADGMADNYPKYLNMYCNVPEPIDTGDVYQSYKEYGFSFYDSTRENKFDWVICIATVDLQVPWGTVDNPILKTAKGRLVDGVFSGCNVYAVRANSFRTFLTKLSDAPWVAQCIVSLTTVPNGLMPPEDDEKAMPNVKLNGEEVDWFYAPAMSSPFVWQPNQNGSEPPDMPQREGQWECNIDMQDIRVAGWDGVEDYMQLKKLWAYPYTVIELSCGASGQAVYLKPQLLGGNVSTLKYLACAIQPFTQVAVYPDGYGTQYDDSFSITVGATGGYMKRNIPYGEFLNTALWIDQFPQWSIVNNSYIAYMASTANTRAYQYNSADWSLRSANATSVNSYDNSLKSLALQKANTQAQIDTTQANYNVQNTAAVANTALSAGQSLLNGQVGSAVFGTISSGVNLASSVAQQNNNLALASQQLANNQATGLDINTSNYELANYVNQGNYDNQVAGIDAGYADAQLMSPSQSGNLGGNGFRYANGLMFTVFLKFKRIMPEAVTRCGDYFYRFGYAVHRYIEMPDDLCVNKYYSYWKVQDMQVSSADSTESERDVIRGIFSQGVTVWKNPGLIGTVLPKDNVVESSGYGKYY